MTKKQKPSETISAQIISLSHDGRGIAHINGKTVFIEGGLPGEEVTFVYTKKRSQYDEGRVVEVLKKSEYRAAPKCPYFGVCGGCNLQHFASSKQLELKQQVLLEQLQHFGNLQPKTILPPIVGPIWGYRGKARLGVKYVAKKGKVLVGFREKNGRFLADMQSCKILHDSVGMKIAALSELIEGLDSFKAIPQIEVAVGDKTTALIIRHMEDLPEEDLDKLRTFAEKHGFSTYLQSKGPDTVHLLYPEEESLSYKLQDMELMFHPTDFTQVNSNINQQMVMSALELLDLQPDEAVLDLFCGLGNFTLPLAKCCKNIVGVEGSNEMVVRARNNAAHNNIENAEFYAANLAEDFAGNSWAKQQYDKILLDPPRTGALEIIEYLSKFKAKKIVYISCNPATLARDAGILVKHSYKLSKAGIMDMFPHTSHVEAIALFELC